MHTLRRGLLAGVLASLVLAMFDFVTVGAPGNGLPPVLRWFGITVADPAISHWAGLFLLIVLGAVWGLIFGALQRDNLITAGHPLLTGLALGVLWWFIFELLLTNILNHASSPLSLSFGRFLASFPSSSNGKRVRQQRHRSASGCMACTHLQARASCPHRDETMAWRRASVSYALIGCS